MKHKKLDNFLFFIAGFVAGGFLLMIILSVLQSSRLSKYEQIIDKLQKQNKSFRQKIPEKSCKNSPESERCIFCGKPISTDEIICGSCLKNNL